MGEYPKVIQFSAEGMADPEDALYCKVFNGVREIVWYHVVPNKYEARFDTKINGVKHTVSYPLGPIGIIDYGFAHEVGLLRAPARSELRNQYDKANPSLEPTNEDIADTHD